MSVVRLALAFVVVVVAAACGPLHYQIQSSELATGADADIYADVKNDQGVTLLEIKATNLAQPARIKDGTANFVAWSRKDKEATWARVAALKYDEGARTGELLGVSVANTSFDLQITVEVNADAEAPSDGVLFAQRVGS